MRHKKLKATSPTKKTAKKGPSLPKKAKKPAKKAKKALTFNQLQMYWYKKLKDAGFKDLEFFDGKHKDPGPLLKGQSLTTLGQRFNAETMQHYRRVTTWLAYNYADLRSRRLLRLYAKGYTYRQISADLKRLGYKGAHLAEVYKSIQKMLPIIMEWNKKHIEGLDFVPNLRLVR